MIVERIAARLKGARQLRLRSAGDVHKLLWPQFLGLSREHLWRVDLDARGCLLGAELVSIGTIDSTAAHAREIFGPALQAGACKLFLAHNHPSGALEPSPQDRAQAGRLDLCADILGLTILDHVIIHEDRFLGIKDGTPWKTKRRPLNNTF